MLTLRKFEGGMLLVTLHQIVVEHSWSSMRVICLQPYNPEDVLHFGKPEQAYEGRPRWWMRVFGSGFYKKMTAKLISLGM